MVQGFPDFKIKKTAMCKRCALKKHSKTLFPSTEQRSRETLYLKHSDICGQMSSPSLTGSKYYVYFIDDSS
jgi:hypothetical protein